MEVGRAGSLCDKELHQEELNKCQLSPCMRWMLNDMPLVQDFLFLKYLQSSKK